MTVREIVLSQLKKACPAYTATYEASAMMNVLAGGMSVDARFVYIEEFLMGSFRFMRGRRPVKKPRVELYFCRFIRENEANSLWRAGAPGVTAEVRELVREEIEQEAVLPFLASLNTCDDIICDATGVEYTFEYPLPRFDDGEISVKVIIPIEVATCTLGVVGGLNSSVSSTDSPYTAFVKMVNESLGRLTAKLDTKADVTALTGVLTSLDNVLNLLFGKANVTDLQAVANALSDKASVSSLQSVIDTLSEKASASDLQTVANALSGKANSSDLQEVADALANKADLSGGKLVDSQVPDKLLTESILSDQPFDWTVLSSKEGNFAFIDTTDSTNRPTGIDLPASGQQIRYNAFTFGRVNGYASTFLVAVGTGDIYSLQRSDDGAVVVVRFFKGGTPEVIVDLNFESVEPYTYVVPRAMKFTDLTYQSALAPTLSVALNTDLIRYAEVIITPTAVGLVTLIGKLL